MRTAFFKITSSNQTKADEKVIKKKTTLSNQKKKVDEISIFSKSPLVKGNPFVKKGR